MTTLYGAIGGVGTAAVEAALAIAGVSVAYVEAPPWESGDASDRLRRINPLGQVPTLVLDDGAVLTESAAILVHLGLTHPHCGLLPANEKARAQNLRGLVFIAANCYPDISVVDYPERYCSDCTESEAGRIRSATRHHLHALWDAFADTFAATPFLAGERVGALDLLAAAVSKCFGTRVHLQRSRPAFAALLDRIDGDPHFAAVHDRHWPKAA